MATPTVKPYQKIEFEPRAYRREGKTEKALLTYDKSLERLTKEGYERHPAPAESFSLLIGLLEGKLPPDLEEIAKDMLASYGEWFNMVVERKKDVLALSSDPKNLRWKKDRYVLDGKTLQCASQHEFKIDSLSSGSYIDLKDVPEDLVAFLYSKPFDQLPAAMQEGGHRAQLYLPQEGIIRPVGHGSVGFVGRFDVYFGDYGASSGVRRASEASVAQKIGALSLEETLIKKNT